MGKSSLFAYNDLTRSLMAVEREKEQQNDKELRKIFFVIL